ncbi:MULTISPECIES: aminoglycoside 6'-N-acetyltransferase [unclassified Fusibacter]|uniref:aminoglycoside 6'-N-acetyltransferase n=1 Tax=unclassified Fusibacter TaxID=2624464 RepID=UPI001013B6E7|nr:MULTISPECIES: aminoglycoside 6'-N-acetyltransferase [unclassified Fusibacter]MCK8058129.1 GNAT family N-acetyltransferase [Fusibacter sp. A2]NPE20711.1 GNAT family N-acetyltransferase [Fusibacter sp. A1]RXV62915.1 GNAT family N-acetyltransferase [Fusibacter sp. A1]
MIITADQSNIDKLVELGLKLWPDNENIELKAEFEESLLAEDEAMFLYEDDKKHLIGFMQLSLRNHYVEGCETTPVAYLEGIFVEEHARRSGIAQEMVRFAEEWGKAKGCKELGSDCELENTLSIDFHSAVGFEEANRLVCFIKTIG